VVPGEGNLFYLPNIQAAHLGTDVILDNIVFVSLLVGSVFDNTPDLKKYISLA